MNQAMAPDRPIRWVIVCAVAALVCVAGFVLAASAATSSAVPTWDQHLLASLEAARTPALTGLFQTVSFFGEAGPMATVITALVVLLIARGRRGYAVLLAASMSVGWPMEAAAKSIFQRSRPPVSGALVPMPASYGFPSGHAFVSLVLCGLLVFIGCQLVRAIGIRIVCGVTALVLVLLMGVSRVYLGVHWPMDVLGSWCLGGAWLALCLGAFSIWRTRPTHPHTMPVAGPRVNDPPTATQGEAP